MHTHRYIEAWSEPAEGSIVQWRYPIRWCAALEAWSERGGRVAEEHSTKPRLASVTIGLKPSMTASVHSAFSDVAALDALKSSASGIRTQESQLSAQARLAVAMLARLDVRPENGRTTADAQL